MKHYFRYLSCISVLWFNFQCCYESMLNYLVRFFGCLSCYLSRYLSLVLIVCFWTFYILFLIVHASNLPGRCHYMDMALSKRRLMFSMSRYLARDQFSVYSPRSYRIRQFINPKTVSCNMQVMSWELSIYGWWDDINVYTVLILQFLICSLSSRLFLCFFTSSKT